MDTALIKQHVLYNPIVEGRDTKGTDIALAHARPKKWFKRGKVSKDTRPHSALYAASCLAPEEPGSEAQLPPGPCGQTTILYGHSAAEPAAFRLSRFSVVKKAYEHAHMQCKICDKKGHTDSFCPSQRTDPEPAERSDFADTLIAMPREDVEARYGTKDIPSVMLDLEARGAELNSGNPWAGSPARRDKLRARLGYWKSIGCDDKVLSWIAYGNKLTFHDPSEIKNLAFPNPTSARDNAEFVEKECQEALDDGSALLVDYSFARVINPILVDLKKRNGKRRLCLDLRYPNSQTAAAKFKLATLLKNLPLELRQHDILFTTDMESATTAYLCTCRHGRTCATTHHWG